MNSPLPLALLCGLGFLTAGVAAGEGPVRAEVRNVTVDGRFDGEKGRLVIQADLAGFDREGPRSVYGVHLEQDIRAARDRITQTVTLRADAVQGGLREIVLVLAGDGEITEVAGEGLESWSLRRAAGGGRSLVLRLKRGDQPVTTFSGKVTAATEVTELPATVQPLSFSLDPATLANGLVRVEADAELDVAAAGPTGLVPLDPAFLPEPLRPVAEPDTRVLAYQFHGTAWTLPLKLSVADPEAQAVTLRDFLLTGQFEGERARFTLSAVARVRNPKGGQIALLGGRAALAAWEPPAGCRLRFVDEQYVAEFEAAGDVPIRLEFEAAVQRTNGWNQVSFQTGPAASQPVTLEGLQPDTEFQFPGAARPERNGDRFVSHLPSGGNVLLLWKEGRPEAEGRLFYAVESFSQVAVSPGLLRQATVFDFRVMQGEMNRVALRVLGEGEVTRVQGPAVLAWNLGAPDADGVRLIDVQLNAPQKELFTLAVQMQQPLGAFPQTAAAARVEPESATRSGGYVRVVNEGAVRLEVLEAAGLSQISPGQIPETETSKALLPAQTTQTFAYRFSGAGHRLRLQADNILPELAVSQVLTYHLGETELRIDGDFEVDVREAPLRELVLRIPAGYALAGLNAAGMSDHFVTPPADDADARLRIVYAAPVSGRQQVQLRLERNEAFREPRWTLPRIEVVKTRSTRGEVGVTSDAGFRVTPAATQGLTELATAFFRGTTPGIQMAFRLSDPAWEAALNVERLPQTIQADAFHLFSVGEGIAYGSSVINYVVSGAPVSTLRLELSREYANVEFTGKNVRGWKETTNGFVVELSQAVSGAYTLLATYERSFKRQGDQLTFTGTRPLEAQSEQGYTVVISAFQFEVQPVNVSGSLTALEPGEVPPEYRLFFDAPILAAYRYSARPFNLALALKPFAQGEIVSQVVDRAALVTRVSGEGQVVTEARYFVKNKGRPHLRLVLPEGTSLWAVTVNSNSVVPVQDQRANLIPLPQHSDPNTLNEVVVKLASKAGSSRRIDLAAPIVSAPVLLADWQIEPDAGRRLAYRGGTLTPSGTTPDPSGFAALARVFFGPRGLDALLAAAAAFALTVFAVILGRVLRGSRAGRFSTRTLLTGVLAAGALVAALALVSLIADWGRIGNTAPGSGALQFLAPVQQAESQMRVEVLNLAAAAAPDTFQFTRSWPALLAVVAGLAGLLQQRPGRRSAWFALGWVCLAWATLRQAQGLDFFVPLAGLFLVVHVLIPGVRAWWNRPATPAAPAAAAAGLAFLLAGPGLPAVHAAATGPVSPGLAESVDQELRVEDDFVLGTARIRWQAAAGQWLPVLVEPGVLTRLEAPAGAARLVSRAEGGRRQQILVAEKPGLIEATVTYQTRAGDGPGGRGFALPVPHGLVNRVRLTVQGLDVDVTSPAAASVQREEAAGTTNTVATLVLRPVTGAWIGWQPRSRDTRREKAAFYAEVFQLHVPGSGVIESLHSFQVRPAQGELAELLFDVPAPATVTDVAAPGLSSWRFDPDARQLRVTFLPAHARAFAVLVKSQIATGPLPLEHTAGLVSVRGAAGQVGLVGIATGHEVQLDDVNAGAFAAINLEDFPGAVLDPLRAQVPGLTLRRAFRYSVPDGAVQLKVSAVEPDVRVESQQRLSLGEDRVLLAAQLAVDVTRAGIFRLSFPLPPGLDVESISGAALSHWTELKTDGGRTVTLHLKGKTEGRQAFAITLTGPGARAAQGWAVPRLDIREAAKQRGQLLLVPEQGLRLQVASRDNVTQFDPLQAGERQKGVLAFRLLQDPWQITLDLEQVDAWIQVTSLQHVTVGDAQLRVQANLQYEIENTGVKALRVRLPAAAENVRFAGDQVSDFVRREDGTTGDARDWDVKLHRRVIGRYLLQASYTIPVADEAVETTIAGVQVGEVDLQRGFLTLQAGGRLQVRIEQLPPALQPTEWQVIPRDLQKDIAATAANYAFRLVEPDVRLTARLDRHKAAVLLPARVSRVDLKSVIADDGAMLTHATVQLQPGDKRLLHLRLPKDARFWFAFVNQSSVWPWNDRDEILLPLEQHSGGDQAATVEFFYSNPTGRARPGALDLGLVGPKIDLPLENVTWQVYLSDKWQLDDWSGTLQLQQAALARGGVVDLKTYISNEAVMLQNQSQQAEQFLSLGNRLLEGGYNSRARAAFRNAYDLSQHDAAFNEDARVQLQNLKKQEAIVGLNFRQARVAGGPAQQLAAPAPGQAGERLNFTQQQAREIRERNDAEDNAVQEKLAERLIQQQDAAVTSPAAIRATLPEQGRVLTFTRPLEVNTWAELKIDLEASAAAGPTSLLARLAVLLLLFPGLWLVLRLGRAPAPQKD